MLNREEPEQASGTAKSRQRSALRAAGFWLHL